MTAFHIKCKKIQILATPSPQRTWSTWPKFKGNYLCRSSRACHNINMTRYSRQSVELKMSTCKKSQSCFKKNLGAPWTWPRIANRLLHRAPSSISSSQWFRIRSKSKFNSSRWRQRGLVSQWTYLRHSKYHLLVLIVSKYRFSRRTLERKTKTNLNKKQSKLK